MEDLEDDGEGGDGDRGSQRQLESESPRRDQQHGRFQDPARSGPQRGLSDLGRRHPSQPVTQRVDPRPERLREAPGQMPRPHQDQDLPDSGHHDCGQGEGGQPQLFARGDREQREHDQHYRREAREVQEPRYRGRRRCLAKRDPALCGEVGPYRFAGLERQQVVCQQRRMEHREQREHARPVGKHAPPRDRPQPECGRIREQEDGQQVRAACENADRSPEVGSVHEQPDEDEYAKTGSQPGHDPCDAGPLPNLFRLPRSRPYGNRRAWNDRRFVRAISHRMDTRCNINSVH